MALAQRWGDAVYQASLMLSSRECGIFDRRNRSICLDGRPTSLKSSARSYPVTRDSVRKLPTIRVEYENDGVHIILSSSIMTKTIIKCRPMVEGDRLTTAQKGKSKALGDRDRVVALRLQEAQDAEDVRVLSLAEKILDEQHFSATGRRNLAPLSAVAEKGGTLSQVHSRVRETNNHPKVVTIQNSN